jgi:hypothetical protein
MINGASKPTPAIETPVLGWSRSMTEYVMETEVSQMRNAANSRD